MGYYIGNTTLSKQSFRLFKCCGTKGPLVLDHDLLRLRPRGLLLQKVNDTLPRIHRIKDLGPYFNPLTWKDYAKLDTPATLKHLASKNPGLVWLIDNYYGKKNVNYLFSAKQWGFYADLFTQPTPPGLPNIASLEEFELGRVNVGDLAIWYKRSYPKGSIDNSDGYAYQPVRDIGLATKSYLTVKLARLKKRKKDKRHQIADDTESDEDTDCWGDETNEEERPHTYSDIDESSDENMASQGGSDSDSE
ncbi:hypothetical protein H072_5821 [Dactylellina haptotyla CBS 200.50]|uniref:Uncharacterized protein n=1 Tax=Dactylellina haptotyla (strain CBS 200.50) TaxID=1284197 RepID=S8ABP7_DACHA|nr:hypothetical protein H072_5821 [Dactylellina haptotyla CBS 200.50]